MIDGGQIDRIFDIADVTVVLRDFSVRRGGAIGILSADGGCIRSGGDLTLDDFATATACVGDDGGAIYNGGSLVIRRSVISGAIGGTSGIGGGIHNALGASLLVEDSAISGNSAPEGGGLANLGDASIVRTSILSNHAGLNATDAENLIELLAPNGGFSQDHDSSWGATIPLESCTDLLGAPLRVDGRGYARRSLGMCEPGAVEESGLYAPDPVIGVELLRNGGAAGNELGLATSDVDYVPAPYWSQTAGVLGQVAYGALDFPTTADAPGGSGTHFFGGGLSPMSAAAQLIDVSSAAAEIDTGNLGYRLAGAFGGYLAQEDYAYLYVEFRDETGNPIIERTIGGTTAAQRGNQTRLLPASDAGLVPAGTRTLFVDIIAVRVSAQPYNDGYADDLSLVLPEPGAAIATASALSALAWLATRRRR